MDLKEKRPCIRCGGTRFKTESKKWFLYSCRGCGKPVVSIYKFVHTKGK